ncbi:MAG: M20 family metallopeptidase [SAR202 cluster bacterium]|nr:M20 family metallopeptidase [SAR202 cluster bacterium]
MTKQQQIFDALRRDRMVGLCQDLMRIPSFKGNETPAAKFLADWLGHRGYHVQLQEVEPGRFQTIATLKGKGGGKSIMFNGHIDVNPLAHGWRRDPWSPTVEGDRLYGAGSRNMKGGVAAMIEAAEALRTSGASLKGDVVLACVAGELQGGVGTKYLCENGPLTDMAVVPEPFGADNILTVHAGSAEMAIHTLGRARHMNNVEQAIDAIEKMIKAIQAIKAVKFRVKPRPDLPALPRVNVGNIIGGVGRDYNRTEATYIADFCTIVIDVRYPPGATADQIKADVVEALDAIKRSDSDFRYEIEMPPPAKYQCFSLIVEPFDLPKDAYILDSVLRHYRAVHGSDPQKVGTVVPWSYSCDDTSKLLKAGVQCLLYGPAGGIESSTSPDEYTTISHMERVAKVLALTALDVCSLDAKTPVPPSGLRIKK